MSPSLSGSDEGISGRVGEGVLLLVGKEWPHGVEDILGIVVLAASERRGGGNGGLDVVVVVVEGDGEDEMLYD